MRCEHVLRELIAVTEDVRRDSAWAKAMIDVLIEAKDAVADALATGQSALAPETLTGFQDRYRQSALCGIAANPYSGTGQKPKARALAERLRDRTAEYQRYMTDFAVPSTTTPRSVICGWSRHNRRSPDPGGP